MDLGGIIKLQFIISSVNVTGIISFSTENKKVMWQNTAVPSLRQPKDFQSTQNKTTIVDKSPTSLNNLDKPYTPQMLDEIVANSSLKVDAPEFIPRSETKQPISGATSRIQNRLKIPRCELECDKVEVVRDNPEYIPQSYVDTETDLKRIRQLIKTLTKNPGQFDDLLQIFMETVTPYLEDIVLLSDIVQILVNEVSYVSSHEEYTMIL